MGEKKMDTSFFDKAAIYAVKAHSGVERRGKDFPYIIHPFEAASIVATMTKDQELLAAAVLHDVVEDTDITAEDIKKEFGERVANLVASESDIVVENKSVEDSWKERKKAAIEHLSNVSHDAKMVALGDKLSNARALLRDYNELGDKLWDRFHTKDPKDHKWHYMGLADALKELKGTAAYDEFLECINKLFAKV